MPRAVVRRLLISASAVALLVGLSLLRGQDRGQKPKAPEVESPPAKIYYGIEACSTCHTNPPRGFTAPLTCRCIEYPIWAEQDKHRNAFKVLSEKRSKEMGKILGWDVVNDKRCLACHGVAVSDKKEKDESFNLDDGVSCVVCHGPYKEWIVRHGFLPERKKWRALSRKEKEERYGMTDLWDPARRASLCASCHIGNAREGKFVTHEMYAAGHPPLPSFEVTTFSEQMPKHWQYLRDKPEKVREEQGYDGKELEQTKLVLVGALTEFRESMKLLAAQAQDSADHAANPNRADLDLANFDCYACHHDLKSNSWRQKRGYVGKPGRPGMHAWPLALVKLSAYFAATEEADGKKMTRELSQDMKQLQAAFDVRPFGDPARMAPAADKLVKWSDAVIRQVTAKKCGPAEARKLLAQLPKLYKGDLVDYDSARQIAWALDIMLGELKMKMAPETRKELQQELVLQLPSGRERNILDQLAANLNKMNKYDPEKFQLLLEKLPGSLHEKK